MRRRSWPRGRRKATIPYKGTLWSRTDLAEYLGINVSQLSSRIERGWPESRWGEPIHPATKKKPDLYLKTKPKTPVEIENMRPYTEEELFVLYYFFAGEEDELTKMADFMAKDREAAEELLLKWREAGRI